MHTGGQSGLPNGSAKPSKDSKAVARGGSAKSGTKDTAEDRRRKQLAEESEVTLFLLALLVSMLALWHHKACISKKLPFRARDSLVEPIQQN